MFFIHIKVFRTSLAYEQRYRDVATKSDIKSGWVFALGALKNMCTTFIFAKMGTFNIIYIYIYIIYI